MKRNSFHFVILALLLLNLPAAYAAKSIEEVTFQAIVQLRVEHQPKGEEATLALAQLDYLGHTEAFDRAIFALTEAVLDIIGEYDYPIRQRAAEDLGTLLASQDERLLLLNSPTVWKGISTLMQVQLSTPKWRGSIDRSWEHVQLRKSCTLAMVRIAKKFATSPILRELYDRMTGSVETSK